MLVLWHKSIIIFIFTLYIYKNIIKYNSNIWNKISYQNMWILSPALGKHVKKMQLSLLFVHTPFQRWTMESVSL